MLKKDIFGHVIAVKKLLMLTVGVFTYARLNILNKTRITGTEHLKGLPKKNVLFVSNHQTYFADVIAFYHVFSSVKWNFKNKISNPIFLLNPQVKVYFIAAEETMKAGWLPKIFAYAGSISIKRTWREAGQDINRKVNFQDFTMISKALDDGWVITFPQGTTKAFAPGRRGTAHIIKKFKPVVVPVVIDGFRRGFDKKGLKLKKKGVNLSIRFKEPMSIDYTADSDTILQSIMHAIEQSEDFRKPAK